MKFIPGDVNENILLHAKMFLLGKMNSQGSWKYDIREVLIHPSMQVSSELPLSQCGQY